MSWSESSSSGGDVRRLSDDDVVVRERAPDWVVLGWLAVLTVVMATAFGVVFKQISDNLAAENARHAEQIELNRQQILVNQHQIQLGKDLVAELQHQVDVQCRGLQEAWDRSERLVEGVAKLNAVLGLRLGAGLGDRPECP